MGNPYKGIIKKLVIPKNFRTILEKQPFFFLNITHDHAHAVSKLPLYHDDPFDRILIAQAKTEKLTLVTRDTTLKRYGIPVLNT